MQYKNFHNTLIYKQIQVNTSYIQVFVQVQTQKKEPTHVDSLYYGVVFYSYFTC